MVKKRLKKLSPTQNYFPRYVKLFRLLPPPATALVVDYLNLNFIEQSRQSKVTFASSLELVVFILPSSSILPSALFFSATLVQTSFFCRNLLDMVAGSWLFPSGVGIC